MLEKEGLFKKTSRLFDFPENPTAFKIEAISHSPENQSGDVKSYLLRFFEFYSN